MANAAGSKGSRGEVKPSQQGRAGLEAPERAAGRAHRLCLRHRRHHRPRPRLCRAPRVSGPPARRRSRPASSSSPPWRPAGSRRWRWWPGISRPSASTRPGRSPTTGSRSRSSNIKLTPEQRRIYDAYAGAFKVIHRNIQEALKATGIVDGEDTLNRNAKAAAMSAFEGAKQRFFGHLLTAMKCPSLIRAIEADLDAGRSAVVQLVSTGEALMERRIAEIPASEWDDLSVDLTPRETVIEFLAHAFPVQLQEPFTDEGGNLFSRPVFDDDGNPVLCQEAVAKRDALIEKLAALPPVPSALDQIVQHFGHEAVAEVTGRSRRGAETRRCARRASGAAQPAGLRQPRRDGRFHGSREAHPGLLDGRRHRAQLPRRSLMRQHRAAHPLPAGAGLARGPGDPGARAHPPHAPGFRAALPPRRGRM